MTKRLLGKIFLLALCVLSTQLTFAQTKSISGKISDDKGNPIPGATIAVKGSQPVAATDSTGAFHLSIASTVKTLVVSSVGFAGKEIEIGNLTHFEIVLTAQSQSLNDVIVIGYGTAKKGDLTAPITTVNMETADKRTTSTPMDALQGSVPGVQVVSNGAPGSSPDVRIRGAGSFNNASPLYVVDGMFVNDIGFLNANDIAEMSILKDASGAAIYGVRAANGVVLITTKKGKLNMKTRVTYNTYTGVQVPEHLLKMGNGKEFTNFALQWQTGADSGSIRQSAALYGGSD